MQVLKSKTVVNMSKGELLDVIFNYLTEHGEHIEIGEEVEVFVDDKNLEELLFKKEEIGVKFPNEGGWKFVPIGWNKKQAPEKLERDAKLNLIFRTGRRVYDRDAAHLDFSQTGDSHDIIWYQLC